MGQGRVSVPSSRWALNSQTLMTLGLTGAKYNEYSLFKTWLSPFDSSGLCWWWCSCDEHFRPITTFSFSDDRNGDRDFVTTSLKQISLSLRKSCLSKLQEGIPLSEITLVSHLPSSLVYYTCFILTPRSSPLTTINLLPRKPPFFNAPLFIEELFFFDLDLVDHQIVLISPFLCQFFSRNPSLVLSFWPEFLMGTFPRVYSVLG